MEVRGDITSIAYFLLFLSSERGQSQNFAFGCGSVLVQSRLGLFVKTLKSLWGEGQRKEDEAWGHLLEVVVEGRSVKA